MSNSFEKYDSRLSNILLAAIVAQIPFELRYTLLGLSNLQWTFVLLSVVSIPSLLRNRRRLLQDRLIQAAALFIATQWLAALVAPEMQANALKGALRFSAGFVLLTIARTVKAETSIGRIWTSASTIAAIYALITYSGIGFNTAFRTEEFYIGQIQRLSGSFEYPNVAAAYFVMSLPIVWWSSFRKTLKVACSILLWSAIILTFSKAALLASFLVLLIGAGWRRSFPLLGAGAAAYVLLLPVQPYLWERIYGPAVRNPVGAEYATPWNALRQPPSASASVPIQIRNTGVIKWRARGLRRVAIGYRWWSPVTQKFLKLAPRITPLPHDVERGETVATSAAIQTPEQAGRYILVLELFSRNLDWFSQTGVTPILIQADVQPSVEPGVGQTDLTTLYRRNRTPGRLTASVPRTTLWTAAAKMFAAHPFGVGPDNFRLEYGKYIGASRWDGDVHSNNLYLELLTGSGLLGLGAFLVMLRARRWRSEPASLAIGILLIHSVLDFFLMATPIYFAFWILIGTSFMSSSELQELHPAGGSGAASPSDRLNVNDT